MLQTFPANHSVKIRESKKTNTLLDLCLSAEGTVKLEGDNVDDYFNLCPLNDPQKL